jgi:hypothetical protein
LASCEIAISTGVAAAVAIVIVALRATAVPFSATSKERPAAPEPVPEESSTHAASDVAVQPHPSPVATESSTPVAPAAPKLVVVAVASSVAQGFSGSMPKTTMRTFEYAVLPALVQPFMIRNSKAWPGTIASVAGIASA